MTNEDIGHLYSRETKIFRKKSFKVEKIFLNRVPKFSKIINNFL